MTHVFAAQSANVNRQCGSTALAGITRF